MSSGVQYLYIASCDFSADNFRYRVVIIQIAFSVAVFIDCLCVFGHMP